MSVSVPGMSVRSCWMGLTFALADLVGGPSTFGGTPELNKKSHQLKGGGNCSSWDVLVVLMLGFETSGLGSDWSCAVDSPHLSPTAIDCSCTAGPWRVSGLPVADPGTLSSLCDQVSQVLLIHDNTLSIHPFVHSCNRRHHPHSIHFGKLRLTASSGCAGRTRDSLHGSLKQLDCTCPYQYP